MKFVQFTTEESDGSNTWEAVIQENNKTDRGLIKVWFDEKGYVEIVSADNILANKNFNVSGKQAMEVEVKRFVCKYFNDLIASIS